MKVLLGTEIVNLVKFYQGFSIKQICGNAINLPISSFVLRVSQLSLCFPLRRPREVSSTLARLASEG